MGEIENKIVTLMNQLIALDKSAVKALIEARVPCNRELADHPTVQVGTTLDGYEVGILGILNGLCNGTVSAIFDNDDPKNWGLTRFEHRDLDIDSTQGSVR